MQLCRVESETGKEEWCTSKNMHGYEEEIGGTEGYVMFREKHECLGKRKRETAKET
jgi:hypothetical protein